MLIPNPLAKTSRLGGHTFFFPRSISLSRPLSKRPRGATGNAIGESVDLAHEIFNRVFRKVPEEIER
jgi:hypothetical protein